MRIIFWVSLVTLLVDQASKRAVIHLMELGGVNEITVFPPYLTFKMASNYGINFGLLAQDSPVTRWILIAVALGIVGAVLWWIRWEPDNKWQKIATGLLIGGALGNVIDRIDHGAVVDFLNMSCCGIANPYSFNIADIAVFAGAIGLIIFTPDKKPS